MSPREKNLLTFFAVAGFVVINFLAYGFYKTKRVSVNAEREQARQKLEMAQMISVSRDQVADQMEWLSQHEPEPAANQDVQTQLQKFAQQQAEGSGLTIKTQKPLPTDTTAGHHYHRAKLQITVTGTEESLYRWFDKLNMPDQLRIASQIRLSPNTQDDTKIDCTATIEQWFIPAPPSA
ncbi:MAG: hypothetical protein ABI162_11020 [Luteolibacter sp.]